MAGQPGVATLKKLFLLSGNRCAFPKCETALLQGQTIIGEVCHIRAAKPGGPRYDTEQSDKQRHGFDNLVLMCSVHHTVIDDDEVSYSVERLTAIKLAHESSAVEGQKPAPEMVDRFIASVVNSTVFGNVTINQNFASERTALVGPFLYVGFGTLTSQTLEAQTTLDPTFFHRGDFYVRKEVQFSITTVNSGDQSARDILWTYRFPAGVWIFAAPGFNGLLALSEARARPTVLTTSSPVLHPGLGVTHGFQLNLPVEQDPFTIHITIAMLDRKAVFAELVASIDPVVSRIFKDQVRSE